MRSWSRRLADTRNERKKTKIEYCNWREKSQFSPPRWPITRRRWDGTFSDNQLFVDHLFFSPSSPPPPPPDPRPDEGSPTIEGEGRFGIISLPVSACLSTETSDFNSGVWGRDSRGKCFSINGRPAVRTSNLADEMYCGVWACAAFSDGCDRSRTLIFFFF